MSFRENIIDHSKGNDLRHFWRLFRQREKMQSKLMRDILTFRLNRCAARHGGYVGPGAIIRGIPSLPHGLHGLFISRYAELGASCRIYQNVTIGEVNGAAPIIGDGCLIGAGSVLIGNIKIGSGVRIGAGAVVFTDIPDGCTVVARSPRVIKKGLDQ